MFLGPYYVHHQINSRSYFQKIKLIKIKALWIVAISFFHKIMSFFIGSLLGVSVDLLIFQGLIYCGVSPFYSNLLSSGAAIVTTYFLVTQRTFQRNPSTTLFMIFFTYYTVSIMFFSFLIHQTVSFTHWPPLLCKTLSLPFSFTTNFLVSSFVLGKK